MSSHTCAETFSCHLLPHLQVFLVKTKQKKIIVHLLRVASYIFFDMFHLF